MHDSVFAIVQTADVVTGLASPAYKLDSRLRGMTSYFKLAPRPSPLYNESNAHRSERPPLRLLGLSSEGERQ